MQPDELKRILKNAKTINAPIAEEKITIEMDENLVIVPRLEYATLIKKAVLLDALSDDLKGRIAKNETYPIKDEVVLAVTGANKFRDVLASEREKASNEIAELHEALEKMHAELNETRAERDVAKAAVEMLKTGGEKPKEESHE